MDLQFKINHVYKDHTCESCLYNIQIVGDGFRHYNYYTDDICHLLQMSKETFENWISKYQVIHDGLKYLFVNRDEAEKFIEELEMVCCLNKLIE